MTMATLPPRIPEWTTDRANHFEIVLTIQHAEGFARGLVYQTCEVDRILEELASPEQLDAFLLQCVERMVVECTIELGRWDDDWPTKDQVWECSITRTAPDAVGPDVAP